MIEIQKNYKLTLTENQARQLYLILLNNKEELGFNERYDDLKELHKQLKELFDTGTIVTGKQIGRAHV